MAEERTGYRHDASDRKLDQSAEAANESGQTSDTRHSSGPGHDPAEIRKHDDVGKDRLFEGVGILIAMKLVGVLGLLYSRFRRSRR